MHTVETIYLGDLRTNNKHIKSGDTLVTDAPTDNNGKGEAFSPTDLLAVALSSCMITIMGIRANQEGFILGKCEASVTKHMLSKPRRIGKIEVEISLSNDYDEKQKALLKKAAETCPVAESLHQDIEQILVMKYSL